MKNDSHLAYKPHIDGLRAIAVLSVVFYHFFPNRLPGGFAGVDVFFVISGYLITYILLIESNNGNADLASFYVRRIKRIFPALITTFVICLSLGWFVLSSYEYLELSKQVFAGSIFSSNFLFWSQNDYFDATDDLKPLLNLWSLGVEEQFYIIWPFIIYGCSKLKSKFSIVLLLSVSIVSFLINIWLSNTDHKSAFYLPHSRFWELSAGGLLAYFSLYCKQEHLRINSIKNLNVSHKYLLLFITNILFLLFLFIGNEKVLFPGWWALLPVIFSLVMIAIGDKVNHQKYLLLSNPILVFIGKVSYPLYLIHWPFLILLRIYEGGFPEFQHRLYLLGLILLISTIIYYFVELPIRKNKTSWITFALSFLMLSTALFSYSVYINDGYKERKNIQELDQYINSATRSLEWENECFDIPFAYKLEKDWYCSFGLKNLHDSNKNRIFVTGDSHALSISPALVKFANNYHYRIDFAGTSSCLPLLNIQTVRETKHQEKFNCQLLNERVANYIKSNNIKNVLLVARWNFYFPRTESEDSAPIKLVSNNEAYIQTNQSAIFIQSLISTIDFYHKSGVNVMILLDNPNQIYRPSDTIKDRWFISDDKINQYATSIKQHIEDQKRFRNELLKLDQSKIKIINLDNSLCGDKVCPLVKDKKFLYIDYDHLSNYGSTVIYNELSTYLRKYTEISK